MIVRRGGLGIGLTLVKSLAEMHGGSVLAASAGSGLGSEFTLWLPLARETVEPDLIRSREAGFEHHFVKPVDFDALKAHLHRAQS